MIRRVGFALLPLTLNDEKQTGQKSSKDDAVKNSCSKGVLSAAKNQTRDAPTGESKAESDDETKYRMRTQVSTHFLAISRPTIHFHTDEEVI